MLHSLLQEFLQLWPVIALSDFLRYAITASLLVIVLYVFRRVLAHRRIQKRRAGWSDIQREVAHSLMTVLIFSLVGFGVHVGGQLGLFRIEEQLLPSVRGALLDFAIMIVAHDAYFYWIHRAMHHPRLYPSFHRLHHLSRTPTPWAAYAFAPLEAVVEAAFLPLILLVFETSVVVIFAFTTHMIVRNVIGHAGTELFPRNWLRWPVLRAFTTTTHHDLHHSEFRWNYGLYFTWWDRLMGTEHPAYRARFAKATGGAEAKPPVRVNVAAMALLLAAGTALVASETRGEEVPGTIEGRWVTPSFSAIVEVELVDKEDGTEGVRGVVIWVLDESRQDIVGMPLFQNMHKEDDRWSGGRIYNPENTKSYRGAIRPADDGSPEIKGCIGPFCQSQRWRRVEDVLATLPAARAKPPVGCQSALLTHLLNIRFQVAIDSLGDLLEERFAASK